MTPGKREEDNHAGETEDTDATGHGPGPGLAEARPRLTNPPATDAAADAAGPPRGAAPSCTSGTCGGMDALQKKAEIARVTQEDTDNERIL